MVTHFYILYKTISLAIAVSTLATIATNYSDDAHNLRVAILLRTTRLMSLSDKSNLKVWKKRATEVQEL